MSKQGLMIGMRGGFAGWLATVLLAGPALALDAPADEKQKLKACEQRLCAIVLKKQSSGPDLTCQIGRTWQKSKIVNGVKQKNIRWTFGDARCTIDIKLDRAGIVAALTKPAHSLVLDKHAVKCQIERTEGLTDVAIDIAPKMSFKGGKVEKIWLNVSNIDAPPLIKGAIWTVSKLEQNVGLFHGEMISETNEFLHEKCTKRYRQ